MNNYKTVKKLTDIVENIINMPHRRLPKLLWGSSAAFHRSNEDYSYTKGYNKALDDIRAMLVQSMIGGK